MLFDPPPSFRLRNLVKQQRLRLHPSSDRPYSSPLLVSLSWISSDISRHLCQDQKYHYNWKTGQNSFFRRNPNFAFSYNMEPAEDFFYLPFICLATGVLMWKGTNPLSSGDKPANNANFKLFKKGTNPSGKDHTHHLHSRSKCSWRRLLQRRQGRRKSATLQCTKPTNQPTNQPTQPYVPLTLLL